jgi:nickel/cobalt transporter (NicO) family protein
MTSFQELIQQGTANAWLFVPSAILLGALHGLEPGHSKTMMAAFIIAIRGTIGQAILLGLAATISHTAVVWAVALAGQYFGREWGGEASEPYFQLASAVLIVGIALWMIWRTWREQDVEDREHHRHHGDELRHFTTGKGTLVLQVFEEGVPPRWRLRSESGSDITPADVTVETLRHGGTRHAFALVDRGGYLESVEEIPEPHAFTVRLHVGPETHEAVFEEHDHNHLNLGDEDDAHARAHAEDIRRRFGSRTVTTGQIILFGLTGGLIPCPAAITVLLLCIQLKQLSLGVVLVLCFSIGLALTMVSAGVLAALSVNHVASRWSGFSAFARRAPYASGVLIVLVGLYMGIEGWRGIQAHDMPRAAQTVSKAGPPPSGARVAADHAR